MPGSNVIRAYVSKSVERLLATIFLPYANHATCTGPRQFAYQKKRSAWDALALLTLTILDTFNQRLRIALYCSDVSGAFDKVPSQRLVQRLRAKGFDGDFVAVVASWLEQREAKVLVGGASSQSFAISQQVYQGTVWGPQLWNTHFGDVHHVIREREFMEVVYADDLNALKPLRRETSIAEAVEDMKLCQSKLHAWGRANAMTFDASKESLHILSRLDEECYGDPFKILGVIFDPKMKMDVEINKLAIIAGWRVRRILRGRRFFFDAELILHYKSYVWSYLEFRTVAIYHATDTLLAKLDKLQIRFLQRLGYSEEVAFQNFKLAPLRLRRDIAMLGVIHKVVLGESHADFCKYITVTTQPRTSRTRLQDRRHLYQLADRRNGQQLNQWERSVFGLIPIYNGLREDIVMCTNVREFQGALQAQALLRMKRGYNDWCRTYSPRA